MKEAMFYEREGERVRCSLCPHRCLISEGKRGICGVREHRQGKLYSLVYGLPCTMAVDPIEKKPLYHFLPGQRVFSIATVGCNLDCAWCQNHEISHPQGKDIMAPYGEVSPEEVVAACEREGCPVIAFTYTEPNIFFEYMLDTAKKAKERGLRTVMVSNGHIEEEPLRMLIPYLDAANIDLKTFSERAYRNKTKASLAPVLRAITTLKEAGVWLELTTLVVPGINDGEDELEELFGWVERTLGKDQVVHITRFFPYYKERERSPTPIAILATAQGIAKKHLRYVYVGNARWENERAQEDAPGVWE